MIQDINGYNPIYNNRKPKEKDFVLIFGNRSYYAKDNRFLYVEEVKDKELIYLFSIQDKYYYLSLHSGLSSNMTIDTIRSMENRIDAFAIATGYHLYLWYKDRIYCPKCKNTLMHSENERALTCSCGYIEYSKIAPAVIVGVLHEDKILLTKYKEGYKNYALVAGYSEVGESLEDTVRREVLEEVSLKVKNIRYYKSQPWGMSGSILAGFYCDVDGDATVHIDGVELGFGRFFSKEEIELTEDNTTLTREMILHFKNNL